MSTPGDPFPTIKLTVPFLKEMLARLRDPKGERTIVVFQAQSTDEGEWVLSNAKGRLARSQITVYGPEPQRPTEIIEQALRGKATVALVGEIRRPEDAHAMRAAAALGLKSVGYIVAMDHFKYAMAVQELGPWRSYNILSLPGKK